MVRPAHFGFNAETAVNNAFQKQDDALSPAQISALALEEFDGFVDKLRAVGVDVTVAQDSDTPVKPDAIFPNNWVSFHQEGFLVTYPMFSPARGNERQDYVLQTVFERGFSAETHHQFEVFEQVSRFLEGTGSIIFDHQNRLAYACLSRRTDPGILEKLCQVLDYQPVIFHSQDQNGQDVYHTNVMMALGETFVVICLDSVQDSAERKFLEEKFRATGKEIVEISLDQMNQFAGNMLQVRNAAGETILVMSETAYRSLSPEQVAQLEGHTRLLHHDLNTIETSGGGSARCMIAEVFLPQK